MIDPDGTTAYVNSDGDTLHNDGVDNGLVVTTSQDIVDDNTDDDGNIDWDAVRNADGSTCTITNKHKYWSWADDVYNSIQEIYGGAATVAVDNKGNVIIRTSPGVLQNMAYILGPVAIGRVISFGLNRPTTIHGAQRIAGEGATRSGVLGRLWIFLTNTFGKRMTQTDGAIVKILRVGANRFNVTVTGKDGLITSFKHISQKALERLSRKYGWR